uniref:Uncharacterized protein n=1 Tax=Branchiostoma floridae TaxID=7739 RepID=C3Z3N8_BRAFL|eukprot:XP_002596790.1 hypothetical protein BRAFLDRAFT_120481 [Branchiostoma floridae]
MSVTSGDDDEDEGGLLSEAAALGNVYSAIKWASCQDLRYAGQARDGLTQGLWYMTPPDTDTDVAAVTFDEGALQLTALEASLVRVDTLHNGSLQNKEEAYNMLVQLKEKHSGSAEVLWRLSRSMMAKFDGEADPQKRQDLCFQAKGLAEVALAIDANSADAHKWFAIALGSCSEFLSVQDKIKDGYKFKEHIERALELRPNDATVHHLLGRWCYEVTMLSWVERKVASALFAAPPNSSVDEALEHFLEAEDIEPGFYKANSLYIAKCYIQNSDYCNATLWLEKALQQPINDEEYTPFYLVTVTMLSWVERKVASALFAAPPNSSVDEALEHFLECYIQNSDYCNATLWLEKALQQPINDEESATKTDVTRLMMELMKFVKRATARPCAQNVAAELDSSTAWHCSGFPVPENHRSATKTDVTRLMMELMKFVKRATARPCAQNVAAELDSSTAWHCSGFPVPENHRR